MSLLGSLLIQISTLCCTSSKMFLWVITNLKRKNYKIATWNWAVKCLKWRIKNMTTHPYSYCQPQDVHKFKQQNCKIREKEKKSLSIDDMIYKKLINMQNRCIYTFVTGKWILLADTIPKVFLKSIFNSKYDKRCSLMSQNKCWMLMLVRGEALI